MKRNVSNIFLYIYKRNEGTVFEHFNNFNNSVRISFMFIVYTKTLFHLQHWNMELNIVSDFFLCECVRFIVRTTQIQHANNIYFCLLSSRPTLFTTSYDA